MVKQVLNQDTPTECDECPICLKPNNTKTVVKGCEHVYCYQCIAGWVKKGNVSCPICRIEFTTLLKMKNVVHRKKTKITRSSNKKPAKEYTQVSVSKINPPKLIPCVSPIPFDLGGNPSYLFRLFQRMMGPNRMQQI